MGLGLFALPVLLYAQLTVQSIQPIELLPPVQSSPDSIVQITAEAEGLSQIAPADLPLFGTYWLVMPYGGMAPLPCPPQDLSQPIYAITDDIFLVDQTGGQVNMSPRRLSGMQAMSATAAATVAVNQLGNAVADLIERIQEVDFERNAMRALGMDVPSPGGGDSGGASPNLVSYSFYYGTNLWLAQTSVTNGYLAGIGTNTLTDVQYEIQSRTNLLQSDWQSEGFIFGSETTNWTPLSVAQNGRTNLFVRLKSWADDGSGLPIWWQLQYFGTNGVDPYGNPAGDGYSNLQKFQNGMNPNQFYTPAIPQGVTVAYDANTGTAKISWLPASGNVNGYTVEKSYSPYFFSSPEITDYSASATTYTVSVASDQPDPWSSGNIMTTFQVRANFASGNSAWSAPVPLEAANFAANLNAGSQETPLLTLTTIPANTAAIRLTEMNETAINNEDYDHVYVTSFDVPIGNFTNAVAVLPNVQTTGGDDCYWLAQAVGADGSLSQNVFLGMVFGQGLYLATNWMVAPFHDGRTQLKQNLIFKLRAAQVNQPFSFVGYHNYSYDWDSYYDYVTAPSNYVYSGFYHVTQLEYLYNFFDDLFPFEENYIERNFVYNVANLNSTSGALNTGVGSANSQSVQLVLSTNANTFQFQTLDNVWNNLPGLLGASDTRWLCSIPPASSYSEEGGVSRTNSYYSIAGDVRNYFGLQYLSAELVQANYYNGTSLIFNTLYANNTLHIGLGTAVYLYSETAQPQFQTVEYDFWNPYSVWDSSSQRLIAADMLPGNPDFSPTNVSRQFFASVGSQIQVAGYAKLAIQNGYTGVYGYLGQYFDRAYKMANGVATTNTTGILSPYGNFFATEPGPTALVTMPDLDTGARGTCTVYCVSLQLDKNHDGNMDLSFNGTDATSSSAPFVFWCNNNYDRWLYDGDDNENYEDDLNSINVAKLPVNERVPDCNYTDSISGGRAIPTARDLEDYARLWVCGVTSNLLAALPTNSTVTLSWSDVGNPNPGNPTIDLFIAVDADGGIGYLTNGTVAANQVSMANGAYGSAYAGRLGPGQSIQLNVARFMQPGNWLGNYYIWCGVSNGTGGLTMTIADGSGNTLAKTTAYIQIQDIKQMYERWTVGDNPNVVPLAVATNAVNDLAVGTMPFNYISTSDTNTPYILFVHGWNMRTDDKDRFAETAFKRLYWQGYQGRFGEFRWPTGFGFTGSTLQALTDARNFDNSEYQAWQSAQGLFNKLYDMNAAYPNHVYLMAHSMGNVVAGEALRLAGNSQVVNTYVASQAALPAHDYDATVTTPYLLPFSYWYPSGPLWGAGEQNYGPNTPNIYVNWLATNTAAVDRRINFYNQNDFALAMPRWGFDQITKPDYIPPNTQYAYDFGRSGANSAPWNSFYTYPYVGGGNTYIDIVTNLNNHYRIFAYAAESRSTALGATPGIAGLIQNVDLTRTITPIWPTDANNYQAHFWHSAEFRGDYWQQQGYWSELLGNEAFNLK